MKIQFRCYEKDSKQDCTRWVPGYAARYGTSSLSILLFNQEEIAPSRMTYCVSKSSLLFNGPEYCTIVVDGGDDHVLVQLLLAWTNCVFSFGQGRTQMIYETLMLKRENDFPIPNMA